MGGLGGLFPAAEISHEVDGCDDGVSLFLGDGRAYVVLRAVWCSLRDAAVRSAATAGFQRPAEDGDERTELCDAAVVLGACYEAIVPTRAEAT